MRSKDKTLMAAIEKFVSDYTDSNGISPTMQEVADGVGSSKATVQRYIAQLCDDGILDYSGYRTMTSTKTKAAAIRVPVLGTIACGIPKFAEENIEEYVRLPVALFGKGNFFILRAYGDTRRPLIYLTVSGVVNALLNLFFVIVCQLSVVGVALASAISQCVSAALILRALTRAQDCYALDVHQLHLDPATTKSILALGVPAGFQNAIFAIANLFIQAGVNSFDSLMVKGNSAAANADNMIYDCMAAFYMACASFMSQNYGAGKPDRVKKSYFISLGYSFGVGLALGSALFFFGRTFLALFTTESAVIDAGMKRVAVMAFAYCISAFMDCTIAASRGLGKTVVPTIIVVMGSCVFRVIWVYTIFAHFHTIPALYLLYPCSWTLTAFAEILYFVHCYKQSMALFKEPQAA